MKRKMILLMMIALSFLMGGTGCEKDNLISYNDISLVYERCNNSIDYPVDGVIEKEDILLFNLTKIEEDEIIKLLSQNEVIEYIVYDPNSTSKDHLTYKKIRINGVGNEYGNFAIFL